MTQNQGSLRGLVPCWTNYQKKWQQSNTWQFYIFQRYLLQNTQKESKWITKTKDYISLFKKLTFKIFQVFITMNFFTIMNRNFRVTSRLSSITSLSWVDYYFHCITNDNFSNVPGTADIIGHNLHWPQLSKGKDRKKKHHPFSFPSEAIYRHSAAAGDSVCHGRRTEYPGNSHRHTIFLCNSKKISLMVSNLLICKHQYIYF